MAQNDDAKKTSKKVQQSNPLIGSQAVPVTLDTTTKLDIDVNNTLPDSIIEAGLDDRLNIGALEDFTTISNARSQVYQLIDAMAKDSSVSALLRTYAEDVCEVSDSGHIVWCESADPNISRFVNYLLNVMNVDKNIYRWVYCLLKYGDVYLRLFRESDYEDAIFKKENIDKFASAIDGTRQRLQEGIENDETANQKDGDTLQEAINLNLHSASDPYSYYVEMVADPSTMFELTKYGKTYGYVEAPNQTSGIDYTEVFTGVNNLTVSNYKMKSNDINIYQADDFVHACLDDGITRYPEEVEIFTTDADYDSKTNGHLYTVKRGKSILYDSYKVWREKSLLENSAILNRVTRSSIIRQVGVEVGDMPKEQVKQTLRRVKELVEQKSAIDTDAAMSEYTNPGPLINNIYYAKHNGQGEISIAAEGGDVDVKGLADLDWWNNKFYAAYGIPKQFFGFTDDGAGFNGGSSLTIISSIYAKGVKRVQNTILQAITDAINLMLLSKGCKSYLNNFVLKIRAPRTQEEIEYRSDLTNRINAISNMQALFSDVENKARKLKILKTLFSTLNYGDDILEELQNEINAVEEADRKRAEEEAKAAEAAKAAEEGTNAAVPAGEPETGSDVDLNALATAALEGLSASEKARQALTEDQQALIEASEDDLPTPEELDDTVDFTENK